MWTEFKFDQIANISCQRAKTNVWQIYHLNHYDQFIINGSKFKLLNNCLIRHIQKQKAKSKTSKENTAKCNTNVNIITASKTKKRTKTKTKTNKQCVIINTICSFQKAYEK